MYSLDKYLNTDKTAKLSLIHKLGLAGATGIGAAAAGRFALHPWMKEQSWYGPAVDRLGEFAENAGTAYQGAQEWAGDYFQPPAVNVDYHPEGQPWYRRPEMLAGFGAGTGAIAGLGLGGAMGGGAGALAGVGLGALGGGALGYYAAPHFLPQEDIVAYHKGYYPYLDKTAKAAFIQKGLVAGKNLLTDNTAASREDKLARIYSPGNEVPSAREKRQLELMQAARNRARRGGSHKGRSLTNVPAVSASIINQLRAEGKAPVEKDNTASYHGYNPYIGYYPHFDKRAGVVTSGLRYAIKGSPLIAGGYAAGRYFGGRGGASPSADVAAASGVPAGRYRMRNVRNWLASRIAGNPVSFHELEEAQRIEAAKAAGPSWYESRLATAGLGAGLGALGGAAAGYRLGDGYGALAGAGLGALGGGTLGYKLSPHTLP